MKNKSLIAAVLSLLFMLHVTPTLAGRPLATDDASAADSCQLETWVSQAGGERETILSPACGVMPGLEMGLEMAFPPQSSGNRMATALAFKGAPESWKLSTSAGDWNFGWKAYAGFVRPRGGSWQSEEQGVLGLATWQLSEPLAVHLNAGWSRAGGGVPTATLAKAALTWTPAPEWLWFAEVETNNRKAWWGETVWTTGGRYWLQQDKLGLDVTASRERGGGETTWSVGLGWYGIGD